MREKTLYSTKPEKCEFHILRDNGRGLDIATVFLRENIEEVILPEEQETQWQADEYKMNIFLRENLEADIENSFNLWLEEAKEKEWICESKKIRSIRDKKLQECDYVFTLDYPVTEENKKEWVTYRQKLRDIPEQEGFPYSVEWPEKPVKKTGFTQSADKKISNLERTMVDKG